MYINRVTTIISVKLSYKKTESLLGKDTKTADICAAVYLCAESVSFPKSGRMQKQGTEYSYFDTILLFIV